MPCVRGWLVAIWMTAASASAAQTAAEPDSFEVASVKPGDPSFNGVSVTFGHGRISATNATVKFLIGYAWKLQSFQIYGGPRWIGSDLFSIEAKGGDADYERTRARLRHLLEDRFGLKTHEETRVLPTYELVVAKGGPKLTRVAGPPNGGTTSGRGMVKVDSGTIKMLAEALAGQIGRPVLDKTGLDGSFDMNLKWAPDVDAADANGPSLFTAIQEQLGLKLEAVKAPIQVLVIDHIERPSGN